MAETRHLPILGASACVWREGKVLLVERTNPAGVWALPGGKVEAGETARQAAERELFEETGLRAELETFAGLYELIGRHGEVSTHYQIACYGGFALDGEARAGSDALAVAWADPAALAGFVLAPQVAPAIRRARELLAL